MLTAVAFKRRGIASRLVLPGLAHQSRSSRCDPALIKAIARHSIAAAENTLVRVDVDLLLEPAQPLPPSFIS